MSFTEHALLSYVKVESKVISQIETLKTYKKSDIMSLNLKCCRSKGIVGAEMKNIFKMIKDTLLGISATIMGTGVLFVLVLSPFHPKRLKIVWDKVMENRGIVRRFFATYREVARDSDAPFWLLILGLPFVAILVLLDDYD